MSCMTNTFTFFNILGSISKFTHTNLDLQLLLKKIFLNLTTLFIAPFTGCILFPYLTSHTEIIFLTPKRLWLLVCGCQSVSLYPLKMNSGVCFTFSKQNKNENSYGSFDKKIPRVASGTQIL